MNCRGHQTRILADRTSSESANVNMACWVLAAILVLGLTSTIHGGQYGQQVQNLCPIGCPKVIDPICATDGKTYNSRCMMRLLNYCDDPNSNVIVDYEGPCDTRQCVGCPKVYQPVCGTDGNTYNSRCMLNLHNCENDEDVAVDYEGACDKCRRPCPPVYVGKDVLVSLPVCGTDGVTYDNRCLLGVAACNFPEKNIRLAYAGACDKCRRPCPIVIESVCGTNGVTYDNTCRLEVAACNFPEKNIRLAYEGACDKCRRQCSLVIDPVCGTNGVTYDNTCLLGVAACKFPEQNIRLAYERACGQQQKYGK